MSIIGAVGTAPLPDYYAIAQAIRNNAGIPATETVGVRGTPGLTSLGALVDKDGASLANAAAVASYSDSGAGTANDPYIIENKRYDNSETLTVALLLSGTDVYHVTIRNCWFSGYDIASVRLASTNNIVNIDQCLFTYDDTTGDPADAVTAHVATNGGDCVLNMTNCLSTSGGRSFFRTLGAFSGTINITDSRADDSGAAWTGATTVSSFCESSSSSVCTTNISYCEVDSTANDSIGNFCRIATAGTTNVSNCDINGTGGSGAGYNVPATGTLAIDGDIIYSRFRNQTNQSINVTSCDGLNISYCDFDDSAVNKRHIYFNGTLDLVMDNVEIDHCKLTSSVGANAECIYMLRTINSNVHDNWVPGCSDDAYEFTENQTGCTISDCVGDGVAGQMVDQFNVHATVPGTLIVKNIYGSCGSSGVLVTGPVTADVSIIYIDTPGNAVTLEQRDALSATGPSNCVIYGPIENGTGANFGTAVGTGALGTGNTIGGVVGVDSIA